MATRKKAIEHVAEVFPSYDYENSDVCREYLLNALQLLTVDQDDSAEAKHRLLRKVGQSLNRDHRIKEAVILLEESCQWAARNLPDDHPDRLASQHELALVYVANGQVMEAVELLEHNVTVYKQLLTEDHLLRQISEFELAAAKQMNR